MRRGTRPWAVPQPDGTKKYVPKEETEEQAREREACLSCKLPDCNPYVIGCAIRSAVPWKQRNGRKTYKEIPAEFLRWGFGPTTNREWAAKYGVSNSTISKWRKRAGIERGTRGQH